MKKTGLLLALLLVLLTGCAGKAPKIDEYSWIMTSVQSMEAGGQAVAYGERGSSTLEGAKQIELLCEAKDGKLTLTDRTNDRTYTGTISKVKAIPNPPFTRWRWTEPPAWPLLP